MVLLYMVTYGNMDPINIPPLCEPPEASDEDLQAPRSSTGAYFEFVDLAIQNRLCSMAM